MQLRLEFAEKKEDLQPALKTFHEAVDGKHLASDMILILVLVVSLKKSCLLSH